MRAPVVLVSTAGVVSEVRALRVPRPVLGLVDMAWGWWEIGSVEEGRIVDRI
jgi:hypothetical protein